MTGTRSVVGMPGDRLVVLEDSGTGHERLRRGEEVEIVGFARTSYGRVSNFGLDPGLYANPTAPLVRTAGGATFEAGAHLFEPAGGGPRPQVERSSLRIGDLPGTPFWEWDVVTDPSGARLRVEHVLHLDFAARGASGLSFSCADAFGAQRMLAADEMTLVERGPVWRRAQGEAVAFDTVEELVAFHHAVGAYDEVRNPANGLYAWEPDEAVEALREGDVHGFHGGLEPAQGRSNMVRYRDPEVAEAVRMETLARLDAGAPAP